MVDTNYTQVALAPQDPNVDATKAKDSTEKEFSFFGDDGMSFWDLVDVINPLQHIPIVSTAYRAMTGDEIDPASRLAGGTLYGGPIGLAASAFNVLLEHGTGKDAGEHVLAWFDGDEEPTPDQPVYASNETSSQTPAMASSFAPSFPQSEADAFAAGEASLRLAAIQEFMNPNIAQEVPVSSFQSPNKGAGSAGTWAAPQDVHPIFPTERPQPTHGADVTQMTPHVMPQAEPSAQTVTSVQEVTTPKQYTGFQAKSTHEESLDALRAFARDIQAQRAQGQSQDVQKPQNMAPAPIPTTTSQLNQTTDNAWFAEMMSRNMGRYNETGPKS